MCVRIALGLRTLPQCAYARVRHTSPSAIPAFAVAAPFALLFSSRAIFEDAAVSRPEIQRILDTVETVETIYVQGRTRTVGLPFPEEWVPPNVSPALARFKRSWESFVESLVREWKTLNVLSALLLSCRISISVLR
jgi:hypothetical protein